MNIINMHILENLNVQNVIMENNKIYKLVTDVNLKNQTFKIADEIYKIQFNSIYSVYNFAGCNICGKYIQYRYKNYKTSFRKIYIK